MIKVRLTDPSNMKCFSGLLQTRDLLRDYSIDITDSSDYDYEFVDASEFMNLSLSLEKSIDQGRENMAKKSGDYFLFHGGDSTSIMGAYEVFVESNAKYLFKKQLLSQEDYKEETIINKWFFGSGSDLDLSYDIPDDMWERIKFTGWNVGQLVPDYRNFQPINTNKKLDICAIFQAKHDYSEDHKSQNKTRPKIRKEAQTINQETSPDKK